MTHRVSSTQAETDLIRNVERTVVDEMHRKNRLLRLSQDHALALLFKAYGEWCRAEIAGEVSVGSHMSWNKIARGLSYAVRWLLLDCITGEATPARDNKIEEAAAARLILTGVKYGRLCASFVPWSRGLMSARADPVRRHVTFELSWDIDVDFYEYQVRADLDWWRVEQAKWPTTAADAIFRQWKQTIADSPYGLFFDLRTICNASQFDSFRSWAAQTILPELGDSTSFGSYSLGELRTFLAGLEAGCDCICELELEGDRGRRPTNGSWVMLLPATETGDLLSRMLPLPRLTCQAICHDLTFDAQRFHASISASPFVLTRAGTLLLSPWNVRNSVPQRSAIAALIRGEAARKYDLISEIIERHYVNEIAGEIRALGYTAMVGSRFRFGGDVVRPDLVVLDHNRAVVAVIEFKNFLAATTVGEVADRIAEYEKGVKQLRRVGALFLENRAKLVQRGISVPHVGFRACLLFRVPLALPLPKHDDVVVNDWHSIRRLGLLSALLKAPVGASSDAPGKQMTPIRDTLYVGKWTFDIPALVLPDSPAAPETSHART